MGLSDPKIVECTVRLKPTKRLLRMATAIHGPKFTADINARIFDAKIVNAVAQCIERSLAAGLKKDGTVDMREAAIFMIAEMRRNQL